MITEPIWKGYGRIQVVPNRAKKKKGESKEWVHVAVREADGSPVAILLPQHAYRRAKDAAFLHPEDCPNIPHLLWIADRAARICFLVGAFVGAFVGIVGVLCWVFHF